MTKKKTVAIIGAGTGGIAAAAFAAQAGHKVIVFEKNKHLGGRANIYKTNGFRFDLGPSWYLEPDVFDRFFAEFDKKPTDYLDLIGLDPQYRISFPDGTHVDMPRSATEVAKLFEKMEKGAGKQFKQYLAESKRKYDLSVETVLYKNADNLLDFFNWQLVKHGRDLHVFQSMEQYVNSFFKSEKLRQIIQYTLVFLGGSPSNVPALYSLMTHVDFNLGVFYPKGGFYKVIKAMTKLAKEQGAEFVTNADVQRIETTEGRVQAIVVNGKRHLIDAVVSNADFAHTENLLSDQTQKMYTDTYWQKATLAPSAFLIFLGIKGKLPNLHHHTIYFGEDWMQHFKDIFERPGWPQTPSLYINRPTATDSSVAPKGHENLMILVPIASRLKETPAWKEAYADFILRYVEDNLDVKIKDKIVVKKIFSSTEFSDLYNSIGGNALGGLAHTLFHTGPFRPPNKHKKINNLFFVGANTVPGIGVPSTLISAQLVRDRLSDYFG